MMFLFLVNKPILFYSYIGVLQKVMKRRGEGTDNSVFLNLPIIYDIVSLLNICKCQIVM